jgi:hypothetical protein
MNTETKSRPLWTSVGKGAAAVAALLVAGGFVSGWKAGGAALALSRALVGGLLGCVLGALVGLIGYWIAGSTKGALRGLLPGFLLGYVACLLASFAGPGDIRHLLLFFAILGGIVGTVAGASIERCLRPKTGASPTPESSSPNDVQSQKRG